jgi:hypothetical protein
MKLPGTVPPKVQNVYVLPSAIVRTCSFTVSFTSTRAGRVRPVGAGTRGGAVSSASIGSSGGRLVVSNTCSRLALAGSRSTSVSRISARVLLQEEAASAKSAVVNKCVERVRVCDAEQSAMGRA